MPNVVLALSESVPLTVACKDAVYIGCAPLPAGHHTCGFTMCKAEVSADAKLTVWIAFAARVTCLLKVIAPIVPAIVVVILLLVLLCASTLTVTSADERLDVRLLVTRRSVRATGPDWCKVTSCQMPILPSGTAGFQSTQPIARSLFGSEGCTSSARALLPVWMYPVTSTLLAALAPMI